MSNLYDERHGFVSAVELSTALSTALLTAEEARLVYWSQFSALRQQAATSPAPIVKAA